MNHGKEFSKKNSARVTLRFVELLALFVNELSLFVMYILIAVSWLTL